jgi:hypothetical protein
MALAKPAHLLEDEILALAKFELATGEDYETVLQILCCAVPGEAFLGRPSEYNNRSAPRRALEARPEPT